MKLSPPVFDASQSSPRRLRRLCLSRIGLILLSTGFSIGVIEVTLYLFPALLPLEVYKHSLGSPGVAHSYVGYLHRPHHTGTIAGSGFTSTFHTDGNGFRNVWPWPDQVEVVTVGDSLTFGYGVEDAEAWPAILAQALPHLRVVNLGLIGAGPQQYFRVYETFGKPLRPRLVVVGLFLHNDFGDANMFDAWLQAGAKGNYLVWREFDRRGWFKAMLKRHTSSYNLLAHTRNLYNNWRMSEPRILTLPSGEHLELRPNTFAVLTKNAYSDTPEFASALQALVRLQTLAREQGAYVLLVFQPAKEQIYLPLLGESVPDLDRDLRAALDAHDIPSLDLRPVFRQHAEAGEQLYFAADGHPNKQGYRLIAQEIIAHLATHAADYGLHGVVPLPPETK